MLGLGGFLATTTEIYYHWHKAAKGERRSLKRHCQGLF